MTALLFDDASIAAATHPAGTTGFSLRNGSVELQRLFLHALTRFGDGATAFVPRAQQRTLAGVAATFGERDILFVSIDAHGESLGVLAISVDAEPSRETIADITAFVQLAARMLKAQRALYAAERQSRDSRLLAMVNERLHKSLDRREVVIGIVEAVRAALAADRALVLERSADGERAVIVASASGNGATSTLGDSIALDADLRKVFGGLTVRREGAAASEFCAAARSLLAIPFVVDGRVETVLALAFGRDNAFDDADVAALRSLAFHVGLALSNARLYERERERRAQAETMERVVRILRDTQYVDEVLLVFVVTVSHELPVDCAAYALDGDVLRRRALRIREPRGFEPVLRLERSLLEPFLAVDEPSDASLLPRIASDALFDGRRGLLVPLRLDGALWGCLVLRWADPTPDSLPEERSTFFRTLGAHLEISLANAHAYERELRRAQERETLAEAARMILSHTAVRSLADVMSRLAATLVHSERACVLRWSADRYTIVGSYGDSAERIVMQSGFDLIHRAERITTLGAQERRIVRTIDGPGYAVVPLTRGGAETIDAFLLVGRDGEERFGRDDLRLLQELAALLALGIRNLELFEATSLANRALQESSEFKDDLLAMLAHDFKGPLTVIGGYCELLLETDPTHREIVETVYEQTRRLVRLSEDALILAQTQAAGFSLARATVDLGAFVTECVEAIAQNNPRIVLDAGAEPLLVELDPHRFRHVLDNLVSNGLKYSGGDVVVGVQRIGGAGVIEVSDRGIGIPADELAAVFTRFGRASNARSRDIAGSGVGLYVSRKIVDVHGGSIAVRSKENEGSTFTVTLPLVTG